MLYLAKLRPYLGLHSYKAIYNTLLIYSVYKSTIERIKRYLIFLLFVLPLKVVELVSPLKIVRLISLLKIVRLVLLLKIVKFVLLLKIVKLISSKVKIKI